MEVINDKAAIVYTRTLVDDSELVEIFDKESNGDLVQWQVYYRIKNLNQTLIGSNREVFSPNFKF